MILYTIATLISAKHNDGSITQEWIIKPKKSLGMDTVPEFHPFFETKDEAITYGGHLGDATNIAVVAVNLNTNKDLMSLSDAEIKLKFGFLND